MGRETLIWEFGIELMLQRKLTMQYPLLYAIFSYHRIEYAHFWIGSPALLMHQVIRLTNEC